MTFYQKLFLVIAGVLVGILIGLLIGWGINHSSINIDEGTPTFSTYDSKTGAISLPAGLPTRRYWVTSEMLGSANKGLTVTSSAGTPYYPHYSCTGGPASFWNLVGANSYQLTPLYDAADCSTAPPPPTTPIVVGSGSHTLSTKTGTIGLLDPRGRPVTCQIDVYTFTTADGNTSCITIIAMDN